MKHAIYAEHFRGPDNKFTVGMKDVVLQSAPNHWYGALVSILRPLVEVPKLTFYSICFRSVF